MPETCLLVILNVPKNGFCINKILNDYPPAPEKLPGPIAIGKDHLPTIFSGSSWLNFGRVWIFIHPHLRNPGNSGNSPRAKTQGSITSHARLGLFLLTTTHIVALHLGIEFSARSDSSWHEGGICYFANMRLKKNTSTNQKTPKKTQNVFLVLIKLSNWTWKCTWKLLFLNIYINSVFRIDLNKNIHSSDTFCEIGLRWNHLKQVVFLVWSFQNP